MKAYMRASISIAATVAVGLLLMVFMGSLSSKAEEVQWGVDEKTSVYTHPKLGYSIAYPNKWKLSTYKSNGYEAVGIYDPIAQDQDIKIPDLIQGTKIEISTSDYVPKGDLKSFIASRASENPLNTEQIIDIKDIPLSVSETETINAIRNEVQFEGGKGSMVSFIKDKKLYTITTVTLNYEGLTPEAKEESSKAFDQIISSFRVEK